LHITFAARAALLHNLDNDKILLLSYNLNAVQVWFWYLLVLAFWAVGIQDKIMLEADSATDGVSVYVPMSACTARWTSLLQPVRSCPRLATCPAGWCGISRAVPCRRRQQQTIGHPRRQRDHQRGAASSTRTACGTPTVRAIGHSADTSTTNRPPQTRPIDTFPTTSAGSPASTAVYRTRCSCARQPYA